MQIMADSRDDGFGPGYLNEESSIFVVGLFSIPRSSSCCACAL